jgi:dihydrofolate reductase
MRKLIAAINMTVDGFCDHTAATPDDKIHQYFTDLLKESGTLLYGRTTYQLMESYWPTLVGKPSGVKHMDDFAVAIDNAEKIVFSRTLQNVSWKNTTLKNELTKEAIIALKQQSGNYILAGSPSMIVACTQFGLVDEYQLTVHPVILGKGLPLFKNIKDRIDLKLIKTRTFDSGPVTFFYEVKKK